MTWIGDHLPRHVHVYRDRDFIVKWDLEEGKAIEGRASSRIRELIQQLIEEGKL